MDGCFSPLVTVHVIVQGGHIPCRHNSTKDGLRIFKFVGGRPRYTWRKL